MDAKKALKKLRKRERKASNRATAQLQSLKQTIKTSSYGSNRLESEFKQVSQLAVHSAIAELKSPFMPVLSWLNDGYKEPAIFQLTQQANKATQHFQPKAAVKDITYIPLKSPPCKSCPARKGGRCKCAVKKLAR